MRSINIFLEEKGLLFGLKCSRENYSRLEKILIIIVFAIGNWYRKDL